MDRRELGQRLRALRAAQGRTLASVATDAGLSVPYLANLENGRGNPTLEALNAIAQALGTRAMLSLATEDVAASDAGSTTQLPATLVRLGRGTRFRRDIRLIAEALNEDPSVMAERLMDTLARSAQVIGRDLSESDWHRLLDAIVLVALHPAQK